MRGSLTFEFGILLCGQARDFLEKCKFRGMDIDWHEGRGWISRDFIVKGDVNDLQVIRSSFQKWADK